MGFPGEFISLLEEAIGKDGLMTALEGLGREAAVSVRLNPFKTDERSLRENFLPVSAEKVEWCGDGFFLSERPSFTLDPLYHGGAYYVQDSSAMFVGSLFADALSSLADSYGDRPLRVLDLCAAPGGKTTHLSSVLRSSLGERFLLVSNEVMRQRASVLCQNVALWGDPNVIVTNADPKDFAAFPSFFDVVVADVPCSGEGMFRKDPEALRQWSLDNVGMCAARQRRILADMWPCLREGGLLVYSTCTFNSKENDGNVLWAASGLGADIVSPEKDYNGVIRTRCGYSLIPGFVKGEGQYCAILRKGESSSFNSSKEQPLSTKEKRKSGKEPVSAAIPSSVRLSVCRPCSFRSKGDAFYAVPSEISPLAGFLSPLRPMMEGVAVGVVKGKDLVPDCDLATSLLLDPGAFPSVEVDKGTALSFLHGDAVRLPDAPKGIIRLKYSGAGIGFVKNIGQRCNNLLPPSRRIRMDIR